MSATDDIIFLIGARASGKTTVGQRLAQRLALDFVDTDIHMRDNCGMSVMEVVEKEGWDGFRRREADALREASLPGRVVATGGGIVLSPDNRDFMRRSGRVLYLAAPAEVLAARLAAAPDAAQRPSLTGKSALDEVADVIRQRAALYESTAHDVLDASLDMKDVVLEAVRACTGKVRNGS